MWRVFLYSQHYNTSILNFLSLAVYLLREVLFLTILDKFFLGPSCHLPCNKWKSRVNLTAPLTETCSLKIKTIIIIRCVLKLSQHWLWGFRGFYLNLPLEFQLNAYESKNYWGRRELWSLAQSLEILNHSCYTFKCQTKGQIQTQDLVFILIYYCIVLKYIITI